MVGLYVLTLTDTGLLLFVLFLMLRQLSVKPALQQPVPTAQPLPPPVNQVFGDTHTLCLNNGEGHPLHEITIHADHAPYSYSYGGREFIRQYLNSDDVWEYVESGQ